MRRRLLAAALLAACGGTASPPPPAPPSPGAPAPAATSTPTLAEVEAALLGAQVWRLRADVTATGLFTADLDVDVLATRDNRVRIDARGTFADKPLDLHWVSDGARTTFGRETAPHTTEAVVLGLTRMGILHNVARIAMGGPGPDHAEGGVAAWVVAKDPHEQAPGVVAFEIVVDGKESADSEVAVVRGPDGPVITHRTTRVQFEGDQMVVQERYQLELAPELPSDSFVVGGGP